MKILYGLIFLNLFLISNGSNILFYIPTASFSHQFPFRPILRELSNRGHNLTILTTDPMKDASLRNVKEIDLHFTYDLYEKYNFVDLFMDVTKNVNEKLQIFRQAMSEAFEAQMALPEVKNIVEGHTKFDLLLIEAQLPHQLGLAWKLNCPFIGITSLDAPINYHITFGNPAHPIINPDPNLPMFAGKMNFWDRLSSTIYRLFYEYRVMYNYYPYTTKEVRKYFGKDMPELLDIQRNMSMLFISTHPLFHHIRALNPNTITIGTGLHINPPKALPKDLQTFLDDAKEGVIYFSLGTNVGPKSVNETLRAEILNAFRKLPYKVLMKFKAELKDIPKNVNVQKWVPQQDVLRHPNVKLFITQGGLQSLQESVYNYKPIVAIPFFGDQLSNVEIAINKGYGVKISKNELNKKTLVSAINEVMSNKKYYDKVRELGELFRDEPESSVDKAIWWIEYVIRHKGAQHLKSPGADLPLWKYLLLDIVIFVAIILLLV